ncbi:MAG: 30S ribosomal protein S12, partial [Chloroflexi bacterium]|nr:30S ribosomal protein S12 [Chloroflexota bacterium]
MPTIRQLIRHGRKRIAKKTKAPALGWVRNSLASKTTH